MLLSSHNQLFKHAINSLHRFNSLFVSNSAFMTYGFRLTIIACFLLLIQAIFFHCLIYSAGIHSLCEMCRVTLRLSLGESSNFAMAAPELLIIIKLWVGLRSHAMHAGRRGERWGSGVVHVIWYKFIFFSLTETHFFFFFFLLRGSFPPIFLKLTYFQDTQAVT